MQLQLSMFETGSNSGAWAYFLTHITHATCVLALLDVRDISSVVLSSRSCHSTTNCVFLFSLLGKVSYSGTGTGTGIGSQFIGGSRDDE